MQRKSTPSLKPWWADKEYERSPTTTGQFLDELASSAPTPGGGGAAAVMGATGAALLSMVANITIGKKVLEDV